MTDHRPKSRRSRVKFVLYALLLIAAAVALAWLFGPREPVKVNGSFDPAVIGSDVDVYLEETEARVADLRSNAAKEIVWAYPESRAKTPLALVYLHGFSAAKGEIRPVPDLAAAELGANLFYTRLAGHGRDERAMANVTVADWVRDLREAVAIGERIGEKVILVATSTGGTLAALAATLPDMKDRIDGIVFVSPNFAIQSRAAPLLTMPFARSILPVVVGAERSFEARNEEHAANWTTRYPTVSLLPMAALVRHVRTLQFEAIDVSALFIFHPEDEVVDHAVTAEVAERWGGPSEIVRMETSDDPSNHVVAGDIMSPSNNSAVRDAIIEFVRDQ
ncbi:alpha/beta hydrolase [Oricola cellulosilytica]|uniref:Alpha/beta fold hydrolase n=1 Tax=Oricola cellulosilytica TaxID=1429082 RepID=A0A4R0P9H5_9HYPH|nr:alpha/beta fold hydrolase [Oricola cellulosilytica]TCD12318.1 alpha/beta fold hydrolase [Oricola cellulosilytica]